jgi:hypothetical protein
MPDQQEARERPRGGIHICEGGCGALAAMKAAKQQMRSDKVHTKERVMSLCFQRGALVHGGQCPVGLPQGAVMAVLRRAVAVAAVDASTAAIAANMYVLQQIVDGGGTYGGKGDWLTPGQPPTLLWRPLGLRPPFTSSSTLQKRRSCLQ